ncbi:hypothetical protein A3F65_02125 [Candidatus Saccharibacteria bacterium RIFCSPHIGHO2_12_FULL_47_16b]|nr:MAG: hypothetical protein A3F65_02125 [Candidatus Saccharibacteria bacterium RIFCSPHIGHO2_12_FULL_47_16b]OGL38719.1 MAG: hypothetical protein A3J32_00160 [Candidatus Saccharibacteria bacterium RIFCSPLOWO2_02_FULL_46_7]
MTKAELTNEFSIILNLSKEWADKINEARKYLPASPVRTDRPHMTLIRAMSSANFKPDEELVETIKPYVLRLLNQNLTATVDVIKNHPDSRLFGPTGVAMLEVPQSILDVRKSLISSLEKQGYFIETSVKNSFIPHVTFNLGVAISKGQQDTIEKILPKGSVLNFDSWSLLRDILKDGKRLVLEVPESN